MSREETKFNMEISKDQAEEMKERGTASQKSRGLQPTSGSLDEVKLPSPAEEELMKAAGTASQTRKSKN